MDRIDPEVLISLVQSRPGLWDKSLDCHKDVVQRSNAWKEICRAFNPEFDDLNRKDKNTYIKLVMKKWTNIRDAWRKTVSEDKRKFKPYIYHEQLKFLKKNLSYKSNDCSDGDAAKDNDSDAADSLASYGNKPARRVKTQDDERDSSMNQSIQFMDMKNNWEDAHISFFKGLLPSLSKLDDDETLEFQAGVIRLLQEMRRRSREHSESFPYYSMHSSSYDLPDIKKDV
ncbi:uncharacterized protein LOC123660549 [Melitaea cinxia]|uniref:uncharacterized protein LOC123660549 n=1 Tax=Melitaea cinxia TaxID=113334 RepID=UPI001E273371|nr:uncharacterized protein LOC123660549 [Melitaea cinxia]